MERTKAKKSGRKAYVPDRGDIVWLSFNPVSGHEQGGKRPAMVLSPRTYNERVGLAIFCPITSKIKGYPFEVVIESGRISGAVLCDHVRNLDWQARCAEFIERAAPAFVHKIQAKLRLLI